LMLGVVVGGPTAPMGRHRPELANCAAGAAGPLSGPQVCECGSETSATAVIAAPGGLARETAPCAAAVATQPPGRPWCRARGAGHAIADARVRRWPGSEVVRCGSRSRVSASGGGGGGEMLTPSPCRLLWMRCVAAPAPWCAPPPGRRAGSRAPPPTPTQPRCAMESIAAILREWCAHPARRCTDGQLRAIAGALQAPGLTNAQLCSIVSDGVAAASGGRGVEGFASSTLRHIADARKLLACCAMLHWLTFFNSDAAYWKAELRARLDTRGDELDDPYLRDLAYRHLLRHDTLGGSWPEWHDGPEYLARLRAVSSHMDIKQAGGDEHIRGLLPVSEGRAASGKVLRPPLCAVRMDQTFCVTSAGYALLAGVGEIELYGIDGLSDADVAAVAAGGGLRVLRLRECDGTRLTDAMLDHLIGSEFVLVATADHALTGSGCARFVARVPSLNAACRPGMQLLVPPSARWAEPAGIWRYLAHGALDEGSLPRHALSWVWDGAEDRQYVHLSPWSVAPWAAAQEPAVLADVCVDLARAAAVSAWQRRRSAVLANLRCT
jgi:hypothetical protein